MSAWEYNPVLEGDETGCLHDAGIVLVLPALEYDCEGGSLRVDCGRCGEMLEEGVLYE